MCLEATTPRETRVSEWTLWVEPLAAHSSLLLCFEKHPVQKHEGGEDLFRKVRAGAQGGNRKAGTKAENVST